MKLRTYAPALVAIIGLVVVWRWMATRGDAETAPPAATPVATSPPARPAPPAPAPTRAPTAAPEEPSLPASPPTTAPVAPTQAPKLASEQDLQDHLPKAKLPKMTLEERIAAAKEHIVVLNRRVELMQAEIADLEKKGDKAKADEQRVIMARITAHAEKLQKAIDEGREPE